MKQFIKIETKQGSHIIYNLNHIVAIIELEIKNGDKIYFIRDTDGEDTYITLQEYIRITMDLGV